MTIETLISQIVACCPEKSRDEVLEGLKVERAKTGGLISDESLLRLMASRLNVDLDRVETPTSLNVSLKALIPNLGDVSVIGRVLAISKLRNFGEKAQQRVGSCLIADPTGTMRIVVWNENVGMLGTKVNVGEIVRFKHCYTKEDRSGNVELHASEKSEIVTGIAEIRETDYPKLDKFVTKVSQLPGLPNNGRVHLKGNINEVSPIHEFERKDGASGKVLKFILSDDTGHVSIVIWNEQAEEFEPTLKKNLGARVANARLRISSTKDIEVHLDYESSMELLTVQTTFNKVNELKEGMTEINLKGDLPNDSVIKEVTTNKGERVKLASFEFRDETGSIWVSAWRQQAEAAATLKAGCRVELRGMCVKSGFRRPLELVTRNNSSILLCV